MRRRGLALLLLAAVGLSGCAGAPQSRESGTVAVVSVLGVEPDGTGLRLLAAAEGRGQEGPFHTDSRGESPAAAVEGLTNRSQRVVSCAHVEHLLLDQTGAGLLPALLSYAFQEPQQSTETQLWVVRGDLAGSFSGEEDVARRMSVLKAQGKDRQRFAPCTLRQAAAALAQGQPLLLPALEAGEEGLTFAGFALYQDGAITQWLTGPAALGGALLSGEKIHWTGSEGTASLTLQSTGCAVLPHWEGDRLAGLTLRCRLEGIPTGGWTGHEAEPAALEGEVEAAMEGALTVLQEAGADGAGLLGRAGLSNPLRWEALSRQWEEAFPTLPVQCQAEIHLERGG